MRQIQLIFLLALLCLGLLNSCSIEKRQYLSGFNIDWKNKKNTIENKKSIAQNSFAKIEIQKNDNPENKSVKTDIEAIENKNTIDETFSASNELEILNPITHKKALEECDIIVLKSGEEIRGMVVEIGVGEVKYKKCDNMMGPNYSIKKSDVFMIKYTNGTKDVFKNESYNESQSNGNKTNKKLKKVNRIALWGFILALLGLLIFAIPMGLIAIVMGIIGFIKISKNSEFERGEGFAIAAIIIGLLDVVAGVILVSLAS